jgi:hypothetical protein
MESELRSEETRIWRTLTEAINDNIIDIERNIACLGQLDVVLARVKLGKRFLHAAAAGSGANVRGDDDGGGGRRRRRRVVMVEGNATTINN